ncbi:head completion/stabilization protein [Paraburkholderia antibiotica]|uniref:Head completion/stabilization protein n=1 Tax=Paraburkholderia antibiotica TaxID=2728839 RepID=A0A7X9ZYX5_9BURK|nr:head completion/stabilization protein [Paraburkholderia antibiotica]NML31793.1 head completion/stabilization protein [Paraburkholderia antibiotica]
MSGFVSTAPISPATAPAPDEPPVEPVIGGDGWFPEIDLRAARAVLRLDGTVTDARLRDALLEGVLHTVGVLTDWREKQEAQGAADLAATRATTIGEENVQVARYRRAVYGWALALLIERYRGYDTSKDGERRVDAIAISPDAARRDAYWAVSDIMRRPRLTVELI